MAIPDKPLNFSMAKLEWEQVDMLGRFTMDGYSPGDLTALKAAIIEGSNWTREDCRLLRFEDLKRVTEMLGAAMEAEMSEAVNPQTDGSSTTTEGPSQPASRDG